MQSEPARALAPDSTQYDPLLRDADMLPAYIAQEQDRGSNDALAALVRRFAQGERQRAMSVPLGPEHAGAARRRARLRELQREGVDLSLIQMTPRLAPTERIKNMERQLRFVRQLQEAAHAGESRRCTNRGLTPGDSWIAFARPAPVS